MSLSSRLAGLALSCALLTPALAAADTYTLANFSGHMNPGDANVKSPFRNNGFLQSQPFSGSFVYDNNLVPGGASGAVNVYDGNFPDIALIPDAVAFQLNFGTLSFDAGDNLDSEIFGGPGISYNNGVFRGFEFITNFAFQSVNYQLRIDGSALTVRLLNDSGFATGSSFINATIDGMSGGVAYVPTAGPGPGGPGVPEPATWAMLIMGFGGVGAVMRRRRAAPQAFAA